MPGFREGSGREYSGRLCIGGVLSGSEYEEDGAGEGNGVSRGALYVSGDIEADEEGGGEFCVGWGGGRVLAANAIC